MSWGQDVFLENEAPFFSIRSRSCFFAPDSNSERAKSSVFQMTTAGFQVAPLPPAPWEQNTHRHRSRRRTTMAAAPPAPRSPFAAASAAPKVVPSAACATGHPLRRPRTSNAQLSPAKCGAGGPSPTVVTAAVDRRRPTTVRHLPSVVRKLCLPPPWPGGVSTGALPPRRRSFLPPPAALVHRRRRRAWGGGGAASVRWLASARCTAAGPPRGGRTGGGMTDGRSAAARHGRLHPAAVVRRRKHPQRPPSALAHCPVRRRPWQFAGPSKAGAVVDVEERSCPLVGAGCLGTCAWLAEV